jgi:hypothetical protein
MGKELLRVSEKLTLEQQACNYETVKHIRLVQHYLNKFAKALINRGEVHDETKLHSPEVELFAEYTDQLAKFTYNSEEYNECKKKLAPALEHHFAREKHHPEHWTNGVDDMNLVDVVEMFVDWKSSSERQHNGNIEKSIEINQKRFNISPQLARIFQNTIEFLES